MRFFEEKPIERDYLMVGGDGLVRPTTVVPANVEAARSLELGNHLFGE